MRTRNRWRLTLAILGLGMGSASLTDAQEISSAAIGQAPSAEAAGQHQHTSTLPLFSPRDASGTAWLPQDTPMYAVMNSARGWTAMLHGSLFAQVLYEPGDPHRTGGFSRTQASSVNWFMATARRPVGNGRVGLRGMISLEPWTVQDCGFINALANGEMCEGDTIHDRQHPHDLFMEVAADYDRPVRGTLRWQVYGGLAGEPALGPPGFPHRLSAMPNPVAPISHHWLDSSHITFGLVTTGLYQDRWKAEMSLFNGREPDEQRADIDLGAFDSFSGRLTLAPTPRWAIQVSGAHLHGAEAEFPPLPRSDVERFTASATYHRVSTSMLWASTVAYGVNASSEHIPEAVVDLGTHAVLAETTLSISDRHTWFGRVEVVGKPGHDLHIHEAPAAVFTVGKVQGGYIRHFKPWRSLVAGVGGTLGAIIVPPALASRHSGRMSPGFGIFFTVRPVRHAM